MRGACSRIRGNAFLQLVRLATCSSMALAVLAGCGDASTRLFDVVVIDEAAQAIEAACWIPLLLGRKAVGSSTATLSSVQACSGLGWRP